MNSKKKLFCPKCGKSHEHDLDKRVVIMGKDMLWDSDQNVECICGHCQCLFAVNLNSME